MRSHRQVTFSKMSEMVLITKLSEGPNKHKLWFTQDELDVSKANMTSYIRMVPLHISKRHTPSASTILGLEKYFTPQLTAEYRLRRRKLTKEVVTEARLQQMSRIPHADVDRLARLSAENSKWARERARAAALFLEQDQENERQQDRQSKWIKPFKTVKFMRLRRLLSNRCEESPCKRRGGCKWHDQFRLSHCIKVLEGW